MNAPLKSLAFLLSAMAVVAADAATVRQPAKTWLLDYGETSCTAQLHYGREDAPLILGLRPSPNGSVIRFILARQGTTPPPIISA
jgi:hypothetical protein